MIEFHVNVIAHVTTAIVDVDAWFQGYLFKIYILENMRVAVSLSPPTGGMCNWAQSPSEALQVLVAEVWDFSSCRDPNLPMNRIDIPAHYIMNHYWSIAIYIFFQNAEYFLLTYCSSFFFRVSSRNFLVPSHFPFGWVCELSCAKSGILWTGALHLLSRMAAVSMNDAEADHVRVVIHLRSWLMYTDLVNCSWVSFMIANYCMLKYVEELNIELQHQVQQKHLPHNSMSFRLQLFLETTQLIV